MRGATARTGAGASARGGILRIHDLVPRTRANGPGWRATVWLQGCTLGCPGCFNPGTHDAGGGTERAVDEVFEALTAQIGAIEGITLSGGEPLQQADGVAELLRRVRRETDLSVVLFTGYPWEVARRCEAVMACVDVVIAGPYREGERVATGLRGSVNKTIQCLTGRYAARDFDDVPVGEVVIGADGTVVMTGIDPVE